MNFPEKIETKRLLLKSLYPPTLELAKEHYEVINNSRETLREWLDWVDKTHAPEDTYQNYLLDWCQKNWESEKGYAYCIYPKSDYKIVGAIDFFNINPETKAGEIGYWLTSDVVGRGYMAEALVTFENTIFNLGFNRIVIKNDPKNLRSVHVAERAGYHLDGVMRQDAWNSYHKCLRDTNIFSKLKSEWQADRS